MEKKEYESKKVASTMWWDSQLFSFLFDVLYFIATLCLSDKILSIFRRLRFNSSALNSFEAVIVIIEILLIFLGLFISMNKVRNRVLVKQEQIKEIALKYAIKSVLLEVLLLVLWLLFIPYTNQLISLVIGVFVRIIICPLLVLFGLKYLEKSFDKIGKIVVLILLVFAIISPFAIYNKYSLKDTEEIKASDGKKLNNNDIKWEYGEYETLYQFLGNAKKAYFVGKNVNEEEWNLILELDGRPAYLGNYDGRFYFYETINYDLFYIDSKEEEPSIKYIIRGNQYASSENDANLIKYAFIYNDKLYYQMYGFENKNSILAMSLRDNDIEKSEVFLDISGAYSWYMNTESGKIYLLGEYGYFGIDEYDVNTGSRKVLVEKETYSQIVDINGDVGFKKSYLTFKKNNNDGSVIYYVYDILADKTYDLIEKAEDDYYSTPVVRHNGYLYFCRNKDLYVIKDNEMQKIYTFDLEGDCVRIFNKMYDGNFYVGDGGFDKKYYSISGDAVRQVEKMEDVVTKIKSTNGEVKELTNLHTISIF